MIFIALTFPKKIVIGSIEQKEFRCKNLMSVKLTKNKDFFWIINGVVGGGKSFNVKQICLVEKYIYIFLSKVNFPNEFDVAFKYP